MKNALILHGTKVDSSDNWFPYHHFNLEKGPEYKQFPLVLELLEGK